MVLFSPRVRYTVVKFDEFADNLGVSIQAPIPPSRSFTSRQRRRWEANTLGATDLCTERLGKGAAGEGVGEKLRDIWIFGVHWANLREERGPDRLALI